MEPTSTERLTTFVNAWKVTIELVIETSTSHIGYGRRGHDAVVLKIVKQRGDEWTSGETLRAFDGRGFARVYECVEGAILLERLVPGHALVNVVLDGRDDEATDILADVIRQSEGSNPSPRCSTIQDWAEGFERYIASGDQQLPKTLVEEAGNRFRELAGSQKRPRLLHGDLHHHNVLFDSHRGWVAIDPKGVIGETEYEIGAILRNPIERPELFASTNAVVQHLNRLAQHLTIDRERAVEWGFAQAVLSAIWSTEDGETIGTDAVALQLANAIRPLLPD